MEANCTTSCGVCITNVSCIMALDNDGSTADPQSDAIWILSSTFIVFTMQSGFGLLESGSVSIKNELNIMVKNAVDVVFGGLAYWAVGYGFSFGEGEYSNGVMGWGNFFVTADTDKLGWVYSKFFFQASFATTATTIVSGAMAERTKLTSYMIFSMVNTLLFSFPAHWVWATKGWLYKLGVVDIAGAGPVHLVGGMTGLVATLLLKPRYKRYNSKAPPQMSSPTNAVLGMFMLWWGWLGFNCGSTFGISGVKWKLAARSAATTLCSSVSGGVAGLVLSFVVKDRRFDVTYLINGILGSLVSVTAICALVQPWEGLIIGVVGSLIANGSVALLDKLKIDDPVGCVGTHAMSGVWGMLAAGLFSRTDDLLNALYLHNVRPGLFYGGGFRQLGIQTLAVVAISAWSLIMSFIILKLLDVTMGLRVSLVEEIIGADIVEHGIGEVVYDRKSGRIIYPGESGTESIRSDSDDLSVIHERQLRTMRDRSLSTFHHLLGHGGSKRTASEINSEIRRESINIGNMSNGHVSSHGSRSYGTISKPTIKRSASTFLNKIRHSKRRKLKKSNSTGSEHVVIKNNNVVKDHGGLWKRKVKSSNNNVKREENGNLIFSGHNENQFNTNFNMISESPEDRGCFENDKTIYLEVLNEISPDLNKYDTKDNHVSELDFMTHI